MTRTFAIFDSVTSYQKETKELLQLLQESTPECFFLCIDHKGVHSGTRDGDPPSAAIQEELKTLLTNTKEAFLAVTTEKNDWYAIDLPAIQATLFFTLSLLQTRSLTLSEQ